MPIELLTLGKPDRLTLSQPFYWASAGTYFAKVLTLSKLGLDLSTPDFVFFLSHLVDREPLRVLKNA